jgi:hypothetical protein
MLHKTLHPYGSEKLFIFALWLDLSWLIQLHFTLRTASGSLSHRVLLQSILADFVFKTHFLAYRVIYLPSLKPSVPRGTL